MSSKQKKLTAKQKKALQESTKASVDRPEQPVKATKKNKTSIANTKPIDYTWHFKMHDSTRCDGVNCNRSPVDLAKYFLHRSFVYDNSYTLSHYYFREYVGEPRVEEDELTKKERFLISRRRA